MGLGPNVYVLSFWFGKSQAQKLKWLLIGNIWSVLAGKQTPSVYVSLVCERFHELRVLNLKTEGNKLRLAENSNARNLS